MTTIDVGACNLNDTQAPLDSKTIFSRTASLGTLPIVFSAGQHGGVWSATITDQATYQPFQDYGLPAVDFTTSVVLATAATNGCGGKVDPSDVTVTSIGGAPHLAVSYSLFDLGPADPQDPQNGNCNCNFITSDSLLAVQVARTSAAPTICIHETTGC